MPADPTKPDEGIAGALQEIQERTTSIVRDEIELAKAEVQAKVKVLTRGAVIAAAAGVFALFGVILLMHGLAWLAYYVLPVGDFSVFWGFFAVAALLFVLGGLAGFLAARAFKKGSPPTPVMAIDEAKKVRSTVQSARGGDGA